MELGLVVIPIGIRTRMESPTVEAPPRVQVRAALGIFVAALHPFFAHCAHVLGQCLLMTFPHARCWVVGPALTLACQCLQDLHGLDALFAETLSIE